MKEEITAYVTQCVPCNLAKPKKVIRPPLDTKPVLKPRFRDVTVDIVGPLTESEGMKYLFTCIDRTSRFMEAIPMPVATASSCLTAFTDGYVCMFFIFCVRFVLV